MRFLKPFAASILVLFLVGSVACTTPKRDETIHAAVVAVDAAHAAFISYDAEHQAAIARGSGDEASITKQLADWRAKQAKIEKDFAAALDAIAVAQELNDDHSLAGVAKAVGDIMTDLVTLGVPL